MPLGRGGRSKGIVVQSDPGPMIEVFADIWCPFAHVGLREVRTQRDDSGRTDLFIRVRAWPLELVNGAAQDPSATQAHAVEVREQVAPTMFANVALDPFPTSTLQALALVERAYRMDPALGERASFVLRDAMFEEGRDISDPAVLESIATGLGVRMPEAADDAAVLADWHEGQRRGVRGSPHFFCGEVDAFCPSLTITKVPDAGSTITLDTVRLTAFMAQCLAG